MKRINKSFPACSGLPDEEVCSSFAGAPNATGRKELAVSPQRQSEDHELPSTSQSEPPHVGCYSVEGGFPASRILAVLPFFLLVALAVLGSVRTAHTADTFVPPQSTVVLLTGLPGDVESETAYREQLQGWLDWLGAQDPPPRQTFVFWDSPENLNLPAKLAAKVLSARRETFLTLATNLGNPLVVIAWGHGGKQGQSPVFHVRGPRITPEDFQQFAAPSAQAESRWILFFRESGHFAARLAASRRQIISSEHDLAFTSDPIGLPLLFKAVRANSSNSFPVVAEQLGKAVSDWYEERSLARTEEPTLWLPGEEPRHLVPAEKPGALAATKEAKPAVTAESPEDKPAPPEEVPAHRPAAWKDIARIDPRKFPGADAVVLRRRTSFTLGSSPAISSEQEHFLQILTEDGKHFGDFDLHYSPPQEELNILDCEVLRADGKFIRLDPDEVRERADAPAGDYRTGHRKIFSLPGVTPGAMLRVRYRTEWKTYPMPQVSLALPLADETPVLDSKIMITVARESAFHFAFDQSPPSDPAIQQTEHSTTYSWQFKDTPALPAEVLAPPHLQPALLVSTWADWAAFAEWYGRITQLTGELTPELKEKAKELAGSARDDHAKVLALYNYVTGLRYVAVPLGVNSFRPHAAAQVFKNQFGDCKDKANLFNTLLRALALDACLVLVPRFSQAHEAAPGLAFNHAISRVTLGGETLWVDTTDDVCRFGMLPPGDAGRKVLVIDGKSTNLVLLPQPQPKDHRLELRGELKCLAGEASPLTLRVRAAGFPDYDLRTSAREITAHRRNLPLLSAKFRPVAGAFSLAQQDSAPVAKLDEDFTWKAEGTCVGLVSGGDGRWSLRAPFWLPKEWDIALHQRVTPLFLHHGYPLTLDEEIEITLPAGAKQVTLPAVKENTREPLRWKIEWTQTDGQRLRARLQAGLARGECSAREVPDLQNQLRALLTALANGGSFSTEP